MLTKKTCSDPLLEKGFIFTAAASATTTQSFTVPSSRGDVLGIQVFVADVTVADIISDTVSIAANGVNYYEKVPLLKFTPAFASANNEFPFEAAAGSVINVSVENANATAFVMHVNFLFRRPNNG